MFELITRRSTSGAKGILEQWYSNCYMSWRLPASF